MVQIVFLKKMYIYTGLAQKKMKFKTYDYLLLNFAPKDIRVVKEMR